MKRIFLLLILAIPALSSGQISIHQEELQAKNALGISADDYDHINTPLAKPAQPRANCNLSKVVYGWHPYWSNGLQANYNWSLLSHLCYFSYELDATTGNAISTHSFSTTQVVTDALSNGVRVDLCVTLFSSHATFLGNATAQQTLITNLINLISARGAHGVNIDFEGLPSSQTANFAAFMNNLANQMHSAIPGSQVSTVLYSVDWNNVLDVASMTAVDYFIIMGYDYYWSGSTTTGPNDPLFQFGSSYNYTLSKSVTDYLKKGVPENKLVLGLPYYGREWPTSSSSVPGTTTGSGVSRTFTYVKTNSNGYYTSGNRTFDAASQSDIYTFYNTEWRQCFITEGANMNERLDFINKRGIAGMGIWALGYDDGFNDFWDAIQNNFTTCYETPCSDSIFDIGGGYLKDYYNNEDYTYTLSPANAQSISVHFLSFNVENNYDYLYLYDGPTTASPQIAGSPFTGTTIPADFTTSSGHLTVRFTSDGATTAPGFLATYTCNVDNVNPVAVINGNTNWKTADFNINLTDTDVGSGVSQKFWQVLDNNGTEWRANSSYGFFNDNFDLALHPDWTSVSGTWGINAAHLEQSDNAESNSNLYTAVDQLSSYQYLYHWQASMTGTGTNRRSGIHFFCDDPTQTQRGNSYMVYFRVDQDKCQIYKSVNNNITLMTDDDVIIDPNTWYDYKITYDPSTGKIAAYVNNVKVSEWTDLSPLQTGNSVSLRTGNTATLYDDVKVYRSHGTTETVTVGNTAAMVRYQNNGPSGPSCRIKSVSNDLVGNWSVIASKNENIDWTVPNIGAQMNDGPATDIDTTNINTYLDCNWSLANDPHSAIGHYEVALGTTAGAADVVAFTNTGTNNSYTFNSILLNYGSTYYTTVRAYNNTGLFNQQSSDGIFIQAPSAPPVAAFSNLSNNICVGDSVIMSNTSTNATSFSWIINGGNPATSTFANPEIYFTGSGTYSCTLIANGPGGSDTLTQNISVTLNNPPVAQYSVNNDTVYIPNAFVGTTNISQNSSTYFWDFGDGFTSTDSNPWHTYNTTGTYQLTLIAGNGICENDTMITTITVLSAVNIAEQQETSVKIYPNPNNGNFIISSTNSENVQIEIFNIQGQIVDSFALQSMNKKSVSINGAKGIYLIKVRHDQQITLQKIIVE